MTKHPHTFNSALMDLRNHTTTFDQFYRNGAPVVRRLAKNLKARWTAWWSVDTEDVFQEMMALVPRLVETWDPKRCESISKYVVFMLITEVKKRLNAYANRNRERPDQSVVDTQLGLIASSWETPERSAQKVLDALALARDDADRRIVAGLIRTHQVDIDGGTRKAAMTRVRRVVGRIQETEKKRRKREIREIRFAVG